MFFTYYFIRGMLPPLFFAWCLGLNSVRTFIKSFLTLCKVSLETAYQKLLRGFLGQEGLGI